MDTQGVNTGQAQSNFPALGKPGMNQPGQFGPYGVMPGQGMPYGQAGMGYNDPFMAWVPLGGRMVSLPTVVLQTMEMNLTQSVQRTQDNNVTVALSVLQSAILSFLQFERSYKSLTSKGDDNTQLYILRKCIGELKQANALQKEISTHDCGWLVTREEPIVTNTRELFEHCIKIIDDFIPCLGGRTVETYTIEKPFQFLGWRGWQQQAEQVRVSNIALGRLLHKFLKNEPENEVYKEVLCFHQCVTYTCNRFFISKYPEQKMIEGIYEKNGFQFVAEEREAHTLEDVGVEGQGMQVESTSGIFGSLWRS